MSCLLSNKSVLNNLSEVNCFYNLAMSRALQTHHEAVPLSSYQSELFRRCCSDGGAKAEQDRVSRFCQWNSLKKKGNS
ncbi:hypothetical protein NDU88_002522 [Pleurodeles waltl]|uniref:Uncharacterized protein n=1 Tax=Pleurodeles waltl TaxID=8319 RepID=A0AAV7RDL9_PLEWA|nr:hypothetical protein NDU88_002522 [Pleurodeles waltl]